MNNIDPKILQGSTHEKPDHRYVIFYQEANKLMEEREEIKREIGEIGIQESLIKSNNFKANCEQRFFSLFIFKEGFIGK